MSKVLIGMFMEGRLRGKSANANFGPVRDGEDEGAVTERMELCIQSLTSGIANF